MYADLRSLLAALDLTGDLERVGGVTGRRREIGQRLRQAADRGGPALLFEQVEDATMPLAGGVYATRNRVLKALGMDAPGFTAEYLARLAAPLAPRTVVEAACQEVVYQGDSVDLASLPVPWHSPGDGGPYVMMGLQIAVDPEFGPNVAIARMQLHDRRTATLFFGAHQHLGIYFARAVARGERLPVITAIGVSPALTMASQTAGEVGEDEFALAGGVLGHPVELARARTVDVPVPAEAEVVIEGYLDPAETRLEGPFGDMSGYYSPASQRPVYHITAITHRSRPTFLTGLAGRPMADNHVLRGLNYEAATWAHLAGDFPGLRDVCWTDGGGGTLHVVISLEAHSDAEAKAAGRAVFAMSRVRAKQVTVCDADVNVRDPRAVEWAVATRVQGDADIEIRPGRPGSLLDPSSREPRRWTEVLIDATRPRGRSFAQPIGEW